MSLDYFFLPTLHCKLYYCKPNEVTGGKHTAQQTGNQNKFGTDNQTWFLHNQYLNLTQVQAIKQHLLLPWL